MTGMSLTDERRRDLLTALSRFAGDADVHDDTLSTFLPLSQHQRALEPRTVVVRGERGAGKSELFRFLTALEVAKVPVHEVFGDVPRTPTTWVSGFSEVGTEHPLPDVLEGLALDESDEALRPFWFGHLVGRLALTLAVPGPSPFMEAWAANITSPGRWLPIARERYAELGAWLDALDGQLGAQGRTAHVLYDHLDRIGAAKPEARRRCAASVIHLWLGLSNRYRHLRAKIFVREDLYQKSLEGSADASKLEARSARLDWNSEALYRVLVRRFFGAEPLRAWLLEAGFAPPVFDPHLGYMPPTALPEEGPTSQQAFVELLAGKLMGAGIKKGFVHRWIPNHLQDAHGAIVPRSIINLIAFAAERALAQGPKATDHRLLHPLELQAALEKTSRYRVNELNEEHPVVLRLTRLSGITVMALEEDVVRRLSEPVPGVEDGYADDGEVVLFDLLGLGVLSRRRDGRIDVPDVYRYGYGIKRKGGVARPR